MNPLFPRGWNGRFFKFGPCPQCGDKIVFDGWDMHGGERANWRCRGLADPENDELPLAACNFTYTDGERSMPE